MASLVHPALEAIHAIVASTWSDVLGTNGGGGILTIGEIERLAFEQVTAAEEGGAFPIAISELSPSTPGDWGIVNAAAEADLTLYYVTREALTDEEIWDRVEDLQTPIFNATLSGMNILQLLGHNVHPTNPILAFFLMRSVPYMAGSVSFQVNYGRSAL